MSLSANQTANVTLASNQSNSTLIAEPKPLEFTVKDQVKASLELLSQKSKLDEKTIQELNVSNFTSADIIAYNKNVVSKQD